VHLNQPLTIEVVATDAHATLSTTKISRHLAYSVKNVAHLRYRRSPLLETSS